MINSIKNNAKLGKSDWSVLEVDESDGSFVHISPTYSIVTNVDREHMDYYNSIKDQKITFLILLLKHHHLVNRLFAMMIKLIENQ